MFSLSELLLLLLLLLASLCLLLRGLATADAVCFSEILVWAGEARGLKQGLKGGDISGSNRWLLRTVRGPGVLLEAVGEIVCHEIVLSTSYSDTYAAMILLSQS